MSSYYGQVYSRIESSCMGIELPRFCFPHLVLHNFSYFRLHPARFRSLLLSDLQFLLYVLVLLDKKTTLIENFYNDLAG
jgi:hypothetical protein